MSESPGNGNNKSNKDIIDELTKKIKNDFTENPDSKEDFVIEHKGSSQDNVPPDNSSFQYAMETRIRASPQQFSFLVEFMERHGDLSKPPKGPLGRRRSDRLWVELAGMANSVGGGVHKSSEKWKKVWADWKTKTKKKYLGMRQHAGTNRSSLTSLEERVLAIMGATVVRQPPAVQEPAVTVNQRTTREEPSFVISRRQNVAPPPTQYASDPLEVLLDMDIQASPPSPTHPPILTAIPPNTLSPTRSPTLSPVPSISPTPRRSATRTSKRKAPVSPHSTASNSRPSLTEARRNRGLTPFDRAASRFADIELRRLEFEDIRDRRLHERELERMRLESQRIDVEREHNTLLHQLSVIAQSLLEVFTRQHPNGFSSDGIHDTEFQRRS